MQTTEPLAITPRQLQTLKLIAQFQMSQHYSLTIQELAGRLGISRTTAFEHVAALKEKSLLSAQPGKARSLRLTAQAQKLLEQNEPSQDESDSCSEGSLPLLGRVAAGVPIEVIQNTESISLRSEFGSGDDVFVLCVEGDSMIDEGIDDGDYVICKHAKTAHDGQLVIAIVDEGDATLKRFYKEQDRIRLQPANDNYEPIYTNNCRIEATVTGLLKRL